MELSTRVCEELQDTIELEPARAVRIGRVSRARVGAFVERAAECVAACPTDAIEYVEIETADWLGDWAERVNTGYIESIDEGEAA